MVMGCARSQSTLCSVCFTSFKILILNIWKKSGVRAGGGTFQSKLCGFWETAVYVLLHSAFIVVLERFKDQVGRPASVVIPIDLCSPQ